MVPCFVYKSKCFGQQLDHPLSQNINSRDLAFSWVCHVRSHEPWIPMNDSKRNSCTEKFDTNWDKTTIWFKLVRWLRNKNHWTKAVLGIPRIPVANFSYNSFACNFIQIVAKKVLLIFLQHIKAKIICVLKIWLDYLQDS